MRKLVFKTNYNVLIWHFVDMLSKWDYFVEPFVHKYYQQNWGLSQKDKAQLQNYSKIRSALGWDVESDLFEWAFQDFSSHEKFSPLLEHIQYFEKQKNKQGQTLKYVLGNQLADVQEGKEYIKTKLKKINIDQIVEKISVLFDSKTATGDSINVYLACSMIKGSSQGGANGDGVYAEIAPGEYDCAFEVIIHEYFHKVLSPHKHFQSIQDQHLRRLYTSKISEIYQDKLYHFLEEVIIHALSDVILHEMNPQELITYNNEYSDLEEIRVKRRNHLWRATDIAALILRKYLAGQTNETETLAKLNQELSAYLKTA